MHLHGEITVIDKRQRTRHCARPCAALSPVTSQVLRHMATVHLKREPSQAASPRHAESLVAHTEEEAAKQATRW